MLDTPPATAKLAHFPINLFAMIMGLSGLTLAWEKAQLLYNIPNEAIFVLLTLTGGLFILLAALYAWKAVTYPNAIRQEWQHPIKLSFFPTLSISLVLIATALLPHASTLADYLWLTGAALQLAFTLAVISTWMNQTHFQIQHMTPAWFIPAVGNVIVPLAGIPLGYIELSWFFFSIGMLFWVVLLVLAFYRIIFHTPIDERLLPTLFILIAPPSVGFLAYVKLNGGDLDNFARILYFAGLFLSLLLLVQAHRFVRLQFALSWWAYSFPLAAITTATFVMYEKTQHNGYAWIASAFLCLLTVVVSVLLIKTALAAIRGKICVAGH